MTRPALSGVRHLGTDVVLHRFIAFRIQKSSVQRAIETTPKTFRGLAQFDDLALCDFYVLPGHFCDFNLYRRIVRRPSCRYPSGVYRAAFGFDEKQPIAV